jgi:hypothetical protein
MNSELFKTLLFLAAAGVAVTLAAWVEPGVYKAEVFEDLGQPFFPRFTDVNQVRAIEIVDYDEADATARPLKVELRHGRWVIASHYDYPAEARERLAQTTASLLDLKREQVVSDRWEEHATYGVIDPLDSKNPSLQGRGKRLTLRDAGGLALAELVLGSPVKDRQGYRYVRVPGEKRTYAVNIDSDPSANFADWVETNLLRLNSSDIRKITVTTYVLDEQAGRLSNLERVTYTREGERWTSDPPGRAGRAPSIATALASLRIAGVRPKPETLADMLRKRQLMLTLESVMAMRQRGYLITPDGRILATAGDMIVDTARGVQYILRFGEVVSGASATATAPAADGAAVKQSEDRYLFVSATARDQDAKALATSLDARFADWFYIVSGPDFQRLRGR